MNILAAIAKLRSFQKTVCHPSEFYQTHTPKWRTIATNLTRETVRNLIPPHAQPSIWNAKADSLARQVVSILDLALPGATIGISTRSQQNNPTIMDVSVKDIQNWVEAGVQGIEGGKKLKSYDAKKTAPQIAWRVWHAIRRQVKNADRVRQHIIDFNRGDKRDPDQLMQSILTVWIKTLIPIAQRDWKAWLKKQVVALG